MKIIKNSLTDPIFLSIVCCLHGDEKLGIQIFNSLKKEIKTYPSMQLILANEAAIHKNQRFIVQDLNRSFPGRSNGNYEERLAARLLKLTADSYYLIDIHTTVSKIDFLTLFFAKNNKQTRRIINFFPIKNIVLIKGKLAKRSLIGQVKNGVSLEFQKTTKTDQATSCLKLLIKNLYAGQLKPRQPRQVFTVSEVIPKQIIPTNSIKNFCFCKKINGYPVLISKKGYEECSGLKADKKTKKLI